MAIETNKTVVRRYIEDALARPEVEQVEHGWPAQDAEEVIAFIAHFGIPDGSVDFSGLMGFGMKIVHRKFSFRY